MRRDWDERARQGAKYFVACQRRNQTEMDFVHGAADISVRIRRDCAYFSEVPIHQRRFLEIGCGVGRLMQLLAEDCGEIHGVDISPEMVRLGRMRLSAISHALLQVTPRSNLGAFSDSSFHFVYSFAVFQHIPDRKVVYGYMEEAFRVLKPGGIFTAQFNGTPPVESRNDTWVGVWIPEAEILSHAAEKGWQVLSSEGANTPYLWVTLRKPASMCPASVGRLEVRIVSVDGIGEGQSNLFAGGPLGFATLWVKGLPDSIADLNELSVHLGNQIAHPTYIGPEPRARARQINFQVSSATPHGSHPLVLYWKDQRISANYPVCVLPPPPLTPRLVRISDGDEILHDDTIKAGWMQLNLSGCQDIETIQVRIGDCAVERIRIRSFCVEPLSRYFLVNVPIPQGLLGRQVVRVQVDNLDLPPRVVEIHQPKDA